MLRPTNYLALHLELNLDAHGTTHIIEIGIAIGNVEYGPFIKQNWFVKPDWGLEGQPVLDHILSERIIKLTGITQELYDTDTRSLADTAKEIGQLIQQHDVFVNPVTWGLGDPEQLKKTFSYQGIKFPFFGRRLIDVKHLYLFIEAANGRTLAGGLRKAMARHGLKFEGTPHRAANDAVNTLTFFFHLLERQHHLEQFVQSCKQL